MRYGEQGDPKLPCVLIHDSLDVNADGASAFVKDGLMTGEVG